MATAIGTYASRAPLKLRLGITDTTDDTLLQDICDWVNSNIEGFTHRILAPITYSATLFDGRDAVEYGRCMLIPSGITTITLLQLASYTGGPLQTIPLTDVYIRPTPTDRDPGWPGTELWMTDVPSVSNPLPFFAPAFANVSITGTGGFVTPDEVIDVGLNAAVERWRRRGAGGGNASQIGTSGERAFINLLSDDDLATLRRYSIHQTIIV